MSSEDKAMASCVTSLSPKAMASEPDLNMMMMSRSNMEHSQTNGQANAVLGPVAIFWDIENCPVPSDVRPEDVAGNIRMALRMHPVVRGAVTMLSAYGDFNAFPRRLREGCQRTGVKLVDVPNGRKDAADKAILVDMFLFALDNRPPSSIMLISGDVDFAPALHILGQRGYTIVISIPSSVTVSSALSSAGSFVWDWPSLARGEGIVIPRSLVRRLADYPCYVNSGNVGQFPDNQNEEEAIIYTGTSRNEYVGRPPINQMYCYNTFQTTREPSKALYTVEDGNCGTSSRPHNFSCGPSESPETNQSLTDEQSWWVRPGDLQGLKGQLIRLFELSGGCVPLVRIPSEYLKLFGRHLYVSEYGAVKLVHLFEKLADSFVVIGKGHRKMICLCNSGDRNLKNYSSTPIILKKKSTGSSVLEESTIGACQQLGSSSDDLSEDEPNINPDIDGTYVFNEHLDSFRREIQELLVCYACPVPLGNFESLYEQRYKKIIDYESFGVTGLEELVEKVKDVVDLHEDQASKSKFLIANYTTG
ncbi:hypothetical protein BDA96_08G082100 [Sorghum bicolor]|jgi:hypothetical protein|uniref:HTH OST-type domain-containing protein n=2 Tax=Sorghum bicolor TaxID=4558 RepID=A0A1B6PCC7_SORBI|nr:uncharacterized protein LOC8058147 [Sorghum bicolor]XP_021302082.1 uncharacterized protein LOC8058147 [Sorghum bicolor]KAG0520530.1 hypothetical protein BDA96_08G082100 [Sorghum bicolor]KXG23267.1 hypothetical protein SORBI_3008G076800 [Sorghum bicolor]KXG23268.1 hypothetical protein SORBI_3008G076800 [Sorghum bicolor]OQU78949.1 hypothetical protein SORBI_3008G076800 [Sorghum bicolor]OQU78950.1 hypothetical protein SORBI_3008G076800 [Sorghum bicolor]|eukprot:XP_021302081.1 uncharacterized protein LOC8058147 [Sorghum bicolor]